MNNFYEHIKSNIVLALLILLIVFSIYALGKSSARQALCDQLGGVYVNTPQGNKCLVAKEIPIP